MTQEPFVSVVINCFNGEKYLKPAFDSVFAQTYTNWEIIFWDNASTDRSAEIAKSYGEKVKYYLAPKTTPLGEARNLAMKKSKADLVAILDADDIWMPNRLEKQIKEFWNSDAIVCYGAVEEISKDGDLLREVHIDKKSGYNFKELLNQFDIHVSTLLMKREIMEKENYEFDLEMVGSEEYNLFMRIAARYNFCIINECLAKWRVHQSSSLTGKTMYRWAYEREYTLKKVIEENPGIEKKYPKDFNEAFARANYYRARYLVSEGKKSEARKEMKPVAFQDIRYFGLYLILFLPSFVWDAIHTLAIKHKLIPMVRNLFRSDVNE